MPPVDRNDRKAAMRRVEQRKKARAARQGTRPDAPKMRRKSGGDNFYSVGYTVSRALRAAAGFFRKLPGVAGGFFGERIPALRSGAGRRRAVLIGGGAVVLALAVWVLIYSLTVPNAIEVSLNSAKVGTIKEIPDTEITAEWLNDLVKKKLEQDNATTVSFTDKIEVKPIHANEELMNQDALISALCGGVKFKVQGTEIKVNGEKVGVLATATEVETLKTMLAEPFVTDGANVTATDIEGLETSQTFVDKSELDKADELYSELSIMNETERSYTAASGDNLWTIANSIAGDRVVDTVIDEICQMNPGVTREKPLGVGQEIKLKAFEPRVSVSTTEEITTTETVKFKTTTKVSEDRPASWRSVIQQGSDGQQELTIQITKVNGIETGRDTINTNVISVPVDEIVEVGKG